MINEIERHWWVPALRGILAIGFGVLALAWPGITLLSLAIVFGAYAVADGVLAWAAATKAAAGQRGPLVLLGFVGVLAGVAALAWPGPTVLAFTLLVGVWAIATGAMEIVVAIRMRKRIQGEGWAILTGALSIAFGALVLIWPDAGALTLALLIGAYALVAGVTLIALGVRLRARQRAHTAGVSAATAT
jgi:uncharacterized membrane protein HdeD (DUF308 family)